MPLAFPRPPSMQSPAPTLLLIVNTCKRFDYKTYDDGQFCAHKDGNCGFYLEGGSQIQERCDYWCQKQGSTCVSAQQASKNEGCHATGAPVACNVRKKLMVCYCKPKTNSTYHMKMLL